MNSQNGLIYSPKDWQVATESLWLACQNQLNKWSTTITIHNELAENDEGRRITRAKFILQRKKNQELKEFVTNQASTQQPKQHCYEQSRDPAI